MIKFKIIATEQIASILPLLAELDPSIPQQTLNQRLIEMVEAGYQCLGIYEEKGLIGICGLWILYKYYIGKHLEIDGVFIKPSYRSQGIGRQLNAWLYTYAKSHDCNAIELNCYIKNKAGLAFWKKNGYQQIGIHFQKIID